MRFAVSTLFLLLVSWPVQSAAIIAQDDADPSNDAMCPATHPDSHTPCAVDPDVLCKYSEQFVCPGSSNVEYITSCQCDDMLGFVCAQPSIACPPGPPEVQTTITTFQAQEVLKFCPDTEPNLGDSCDFSDDPSKTCRYGAFACHGSQERDAIVFRTICECDVGSSEFECFTTAVDCPEPVVGSCPVEPAHGDSCAMVGLTCNSKPFGCPALSSDGLYTTRCDCDGSIFSCRDFVVSCPLQQNQEPPVSTECPLSITGPATGDPCDFGGDSASTCRYGPIACPGSHEPQDIGFLSTCSCDSDTNQFVCKPNIVQCQPPMGDDPCPSSRASSGDVCNTPDLQCSYDPFGCPASGSAGFFLTRCTCLGSQFLCSEALPFCSDRESMEPLATSCPSVDQVPNFGDPCDFGDEDETLCLYNPGSCPGLDATVFLKQCSCDASSQRFDCVLLDIDCPPDPVPVSDPTTSPVQDPTTAPVQDPTTAPVQDPTTAPVQDPPESSTLKICPDTEPNSGDPCDFSDYPSKNCRYDAFACPGSQERDAIIFRKNCECASSQFECSTAMVDCIEPTDENCPIDAMPANGDSCAVVGLTCNYQPYGCPALSGDGIYTTRCTCDGADFTCQDFTVVCPLQESEEPALSTVCPLGHFGPSSGDPCDFGGDDTKICRYSAAACPGSHDPEEIAFLTSCNCDSTTNQFVCNANVLQCPSPGTISDPCPPDRASSGDECNEPLTCNYDPYLCPNANFGGDGLFLTSCKCVGSQFLCTQALGVCLSETFGPSTTPPITSCPDIDQAPNLGDPCDFDGRDTTCLYDAFACPGTQNPNGIVFKKQCMCNDAQKRFDCVLLDVDCAAPEENGCPLVATGTCETEALVCQYSPFGCPAETSDPIFSTVCTCDGSNFLCEQNVPACAATECPPHDEPPSTGDACDFAGGDTNRLCRYSASVCAGFQDREDIFFATECQCDASSNQFVCAQTDIQCALPINSCPQTKPSPDDNKCDTPNLLCHFDPFGCSDETNFGIFLTRCVCDGSTFDCVETPPKCDAPAIDCPFPIQNPLTGDACNFEDEDENCRYNAFACPESQSTSDITYLKNCKCDAKRFVCEEDVPPTCETPANAICPTNFAPSGVQCDIPGYQCNYNPFGCAGGDDAGTFTVSCTCDGTVFTCEQTGVVCTQQVSSAAFCFSGDSTVNVQGKGTVPMQDLDIGDMVQVDTSNKFEPIFSFGHRQPDVMGYFVEVYFHEDYNQAAKKIAPLRLSANHMVWEESAHVFLPASQLQKGHVVILNNDDRGEKRAVVHSILHNIKGRGMFAPFTPSGQILVNDVVVSCYVALEADEESLPIGLFGLRVSHQWIAHSFEFPHRLACYYLGHTCPTESYDKDGISTWVSVPREMAQWLLSHNVPFQCSVFVVEMGHRSSRSCCPLVEQQSEYVILHLSYVRSLHGRVVTREPVASRMKSIFDHMIAESVQARPELNGTTRVERLSCQVLSATEKVIQSSGTTDPVSLSAKKLLAFV